MYAINHTWCGHCCTGNTLDSFLSPYFATSNLFFLFFSPLLLLLSALPSAPRGFLFSLLCSAHGCLPYYLLRNRMSWTIPHVRKGWSEYKTVFWIQSFSSEINWRLATDTSRMYLDLFRFSAYDFLQFMKLRLKKGCLLLPNAGMNSELLQLQGPENSDD